MSQENVEALKRIYERWSRDRRIDPAEFHPEFELRTPIMEFEGRTHRGYEGYKSWLALNAEVTADNWFEASEYQDLGDVVLVLGWIRVTGRSSGAESRDTGVQLWSFRDGKPSSMTAFRTLEEALEAAGLRK